MLPSPSFLLALVLCLCASHAASQLALNSYFSNSMVLQRAPQQAVVWGTGDAGTTVTTKIDGSAMACTIVSANGTWSVQLPATSASFNHTISASDGTTTITLSDVAFGDVYLCSGQSNMQIYLNYSFSGDDAIANASSYPNIRLYNINDGYSETPLSQPYSLSYGPDSWVLPSAATLLYDPNNVFSYFSAVCYWTGLHLSDALNHTIPIGLVQSSFSGTVIHAWTSANAVDVCGPVIEASYDFEEPSVLFNAMIHPLLPMRFAAVLWYQGESDGYDIDRYQCSFPNLIQDWRTQFGYADAELPFYFVLLAPYTSAPPLLRAAQLDALGIANVGVANAIDLGDRYGSQGEVHPRNKSYVGERLARWLLQDIYQQQVQVDGPQLVSATAALTSSAALQVTLQYADDSSSQGLFALPTPGCDSSAVGADLCCTEQTPGSFASLVTYSWSLSNGDTYTGSSPAVLDAAARTVTVVDTSASLPINGSLVLVSYAYADWPGCALYNADQLPALPFQLNLTVGSDSDGGGMCSGQSNLAITLNESVSDATAISLASQYPAVQQFSFYTPSLEQVVVRTPSEQLCSIPVYMAGQYSAPSPPSAPLTLNSYFSSGIVLPSAPSQAVIWGTGQPGRTITVQLDGSAVASGVVAVNGTWSVTLPAQPASTSHTITVTDQTTTLTLTDVTFGDGGDGGGMCSGQSNLAITLNESVSDATAISLASQYPAVQQFSFYTPSLEQVVVRTPSEQLCSIPVYMAGQYSAPSPPSAPLTLNSYFSSGIVLPSAPSQAVIWGTGQPGRTITVQLDGSAVASGVVAVNGTWSVTLPAQPASTSHTITVTDQTTTLTLTDVTFGDGGDGGGMCSGQSNLAITLNESVSDATAISLASQYPAVQQFSFYTPSLEQVVVRTPSEQLCSIPVYMAGQYSAPSPPSAPLTLNSYFSSGIVLPSAPSQAVIWGTGQPGRTITVQLDGSAVASGVVAVNGTWSVTLPAQPASTSHTITVTDQTTTLTLTDVTFGDGGDGGGMCSGQSNLAITLNESVSDATAISLASQYPAVQQFSFYTPSLEQVVVRTPSEQLCSIPVYMAGQYSAPSPPSAPLTLNSYFSSGIVLPSAPSQAVIWGTGQPGRTITVQLDGSAVASGVVAVNGTWSVTLPAQPASTSHTITVTDQTTTLTLTDVTFGDGGDGGGMCSGQSNLAITLNESVSDATAISLASQYPAVQQFSFYTPSLEQVVVRTPSEQLCSIPVYMAGQYSAPSPPSAPLTLNSYFSSGIVLPSAPSQAVIWGTGQPGRTITVQLDGSAVASGVVAVNGTWSVTLPAQPASTSHTITVTDQTTTLTLTDVTFGDGGDGGGMCSGQSNLAITLNESVSDATAISLASQYPAVQQFSFYTPSLEQVVVRTPSEQLCSIPVYMAGQYSAPSPPSAPLTLNSYFSSGIVLPSAPSQAVIWGTGQPGRTITVQLDGSAVASGVVAVNGTWSVTLPAQPASTSHTITVTDQTTTLTLTDVTFGDGGDGGGMCSGQSNLAITLNESVSDATAISLASQYPAVQQFSFYTPSLEQVVVRTPSEQLCSIPVYASM